ncbi:ATP-binding protein [Pseudomonas panipatensis]|nr:transporter substrate-binding domain-containing protein [Pseudomonas panipatensis]
MSPAERAWLAQHGPLRVAVIETDRPPLEMLSGGRYEGVSADYLGLLFGDTPRVLAYPSRQAALQALQRGEVDLLGAGSDFEAGANGLLRSRAYLPVQPVLVSAQARPFDAARADTTLALVADYLALAKVRAAYPNSRVLLFASPLRALEALSLGNVDGMIGDALSVHYLINMNYLFDLRIDNFAPLDSDGFSFLLAQGNETLRDLLDHGLARVGAQRDEEILRRWSAGERFRLVQRRLVLSPRENRWLAANPKIPVVVTRYTGSLVQVDDDGKISGIARDYLDLLGQRAGLQFSYAAVDSADALDREMRAGRALATPVVPPGDWELTVLAPYLRGTVILATAEGDQRIHDLQDLAGKRLASAAGRYFNQMLHERYPDIQLLEMPNQLESLHSVEEGRSDASISSLFSARALIASHFKGRLKVAGILEELSTPYSIGVLRDQPELASILEKAQLSVDPEEIAALVRRWEPRQADNGGSFWAEHRESILAFGGIGALLVLLSLVWGFYLNRQVLRTRRAEQRLSSQLVLLDSLIQAIPNPVYLLDRDGRLRLCNQALLDLFDSRLEDCRGKSIPELGWFPEAEARRLAELHGQQVATGNMPPAGDYVLRLPGRDLYVYHWAVAQRDADGEIQGVIGGWVDLTERQQLMQQLERERQRADAASAAKSQFLSTMSHEIRTPMNAIIGLQELVLEKAREGILDRPSLEVAQDAARSLLMLIGNVLDMARIESGRIDSAPLPASLRRQIEGSVSLFAGLAVQKGLSLELQAGAELDHWVLLDVLRFKQVLFNLLNNAIKFTERGGITLRASATRQGQNLDLLIEVIDTGVGISAEDQARLFQPFAQVEQPARQAGSGLGLHISRRLVEMMGGRLELTSEAGVGSCFSLRLPLQITQAPGEKEGVALQPAGPGALKVLAVDDHPANRLVFQQQLEHLGHRATLAANGEEGWELWLAGDFDVVLTDCRMVGVDGYELTRRIREEESRCGRRRCLVLGATANALDEETQRCLEAGMDQVLFKPLTLEVLQQALASASAPAAKAGPASATPSGAVFDLGGVFGAHPETNPSAAGFIGTLLEANEQDLIQLRRLGEQGEPRQLADLAHRIAGAAAIVRARELEGHCRDLQIICESDAIGAPQQVRAVEAALEELQRQLRAWLRSLDA